MVGIILIINIKMLAEIFQIEASIKNKLSNLKRRIFFLEANHHLRFMKK